MPRIDLIAIRSGQASNWTATNPQLGDGEPGYENDTGKMKVGNGTTLWNDLPYTAGGEGGGTATTPEEIVDTVATALVAGNNVDVIYDDGAGTIDISVEALTKADVGLGNVDNTSDVAKPVSTAQQAALDAKASTAQLAAHEADTTNIHGIADTAAVATTAAVALKADKATAVNTTAPLTGGGDLSASRTLDISTFTAAVKGVVPPPTTATGRYLKDDGTWDTPAGGGGGITTEDAVDAVAAALVAGNNIDVTYNDTANTITVDVEALTTADVAGLDTALANKQPLDTDLTTIAGLTATTDNVIQSAGSAWASRTPVQLKSTLALTKSDVGLANVDNTSDANKPVSTAQAAADALKADAAATTTALAGKQPLDTELTALAGLTSAIDRLPYFNGSGTAALATFTNSARSLLDDTSFAAMRTTLQLEIDTDIPPVRRTIVPVTATTFGATVGNENRMVTLSNAAAIAVTLPSNATSAFPVGAEVDFMWLGVGQPTFVAGSGATVTSKTSLVMRTRYSVVTAKKIATNDWELYGDLEEPAFTPTAWTALPYSTNWAATAGNPAAYRKVGDVVYVQGGITWNGGAGTATPRVICQLPVGFRPPVQRRFVIWDNNAGVARRIIDDTNGQIYIESAVDAVHSFEIDLIHSTTA